MYHKNIRKRQIKEKTIAHILDKSIHTERERGEEGKRGRGEEGRERREFRNENLD
jgi:hypothetical protein